MENKKRKVIDIPEDVLRFFTVKAAHELTSAKALIEKLIIDEYKRSKKEENGRE
ncbi:MAG: hypothetical protein ACRC26_00210 [Bacteroidales bacterium]